MSDTVNEPEVPTTPDATQQVTDTATTGRVEFTPEQQKEVDRILKERIERCLLYTSPSPRD